ncbi:hypothetical protein CNEONATNEC26_01090 [Clostridium neonatale]|nr:hypothetical protein CNEONATNEC26_01090 [Clostridium neonatale]
MKQRNEDLMVGCYPLNLARPLFNVGMILEKR